MTGAEPLVCIGWCYTKKYLEKCFEITSGNVFSQALQEAAMVLALHLPPALRCRQCNGNVQ